MIPNKVSEEGKRALHRFQPWMLNFNIPLTTISLGPRLTLSVLYILLGNVVSCITTLTMLFIYTICPAFLPPVEHAVLLKGQY